MRTIEPILIRQGPLCVHPGLSGAEFAEYPVFQPMPCDLRALTASRHIPLLLTAWKPHLIDLIADAVVVAVELVGGRVRVTGRRGTDRIHGWAVRDGQPRRPPYC